MKNLILIGMPGCGKSTLGVVLAKNCNMGFCDTDLIIQQFEKKSLQDIINSQGVESFLEKEEKYLLSLDGENIVIATGGSAVLSDKAMYHLKKNGVVVYLKTDCHTITKRLKNVKTRGIAFDKGQTISDIYNLRTPLYEKYADITIECKKRKFSDIVCEISEIINTTEILKN